MTRLHAQSRTGLAAKVTLMLVALYQTCLSPFLGGQCRFVPTCSNYFAEAVRARGVLRGGLMGLRRLLRCHPFAKGGCDPVDG